eukprot:m51a1_g13007 hypothetical protein (215) ;mRNA; f:1506-2913
MPSTLCGDGVVGYGEDCDTGADPTNSSGTGCAWCTCDTEHHWLLSPLGHFCTKCGDSVVDEGETCDGTAGCDASCRCSAGWTPGTTMGSSTCSRCGNHVVDDWREECDDNSTACVACNAIAWVLVAQDWCAADASCAWCQSARSCMPKALSRTCQECGVFNMSREVWLLCCSSALLLTAACRSGITSCVSCSAYGAADTCDKSPCADTAETPLF